MYGIQEIAKTLVINDNIHHTVLLTHISYLPTGFPKCLNKKRVRSQSAGNITYLEL